MQSMHVEIRSKAAQVGLAEVSLNKSNIRRLCVYCLSLARRASFSTQAPVQSLMTANQRWTRTRILSQSSIYVEPWSLKAGTHFTEWAE